MHARSGREAWRLWYAWLPVKPRDDGIHWLEFVWRRSSSSRLASPVFQRSGDKDREAVTEEEGAPHDCALGIAGFVRVAEAIDALDVI